VTGRGLRRGLRRIVDALQLGLFDALEPVAPTAPPPPASAPPIEPAGDAPSIDAPWRHREATREAVLDGRRVAFRLVRVRRRSIGFVVDSDGLTVRAARRVPLREIDDAVQEKRRWIVARLLEQRERAAGAAAARVVWRDGVAIDYLGGKLAVVLDPAAAVAGGAALAASAGAVQRLVVALPRDAAAERIRARRAVSSPSARRTSLPSSASASAASRSRRRRRAGAAPAPTARCGCTGG
jgi:hypothetical protein